MSEKALSHAGNRKLVYHNYVTEDIDECGRLRDIKFNIPENFNFAFDVVDTIAARQPDKTAMVWEAGNHGEIRRFTFSDMSRYSSKTANFFKRLGVCKGDRVMLILKRHYEFWFCMLALHKIGAIAIPAPVQLTYTDINYRFEVSGAKAIVCTADGEVADAAERAAIENPYLSIKVIVHGKRSGWLNFDDEISNESDVFERPSGSDAIKCSDPMLLYFTSGTTGYPKMALHDHTYPLGHLVTARWWHNVDPDGLHFAISDSGWGKAMWGKLYGQWLCEAPIFTFDFDRFNADEVLSMFKKHNITTFCAPPTMYRMFIKEDISKYDLSSLKYCCTAGEALNAEVYHQWEKLTGLKIMEGFGQTETTLVLGNLIGTSPRPGAMGLPNPQYNVKLVDNDGKPVKHGDVGEIVLDTTEGHPCGMFVGYYRKPELTKCAWHDGLYHTCDMAWCDEDGYYWYVGRTDDIIKSSGYKIGPFEIESVLMELPFVLECAITGVPDEVRGKIVKATIVLVKTKQPSEELKKEIQAYVKNRTAPYKYPRIVEFVDELPKTVSGKIRRVEIRNKNK
jgi:acetyl-CoA synthetase